ncbi:hypothetical protein HHK36_013092 [Tetracentron sinense]|uniref:J domain-containing protein n=1 Tax=Tetracentron sinense TaxID=13715 RepID=A0A834Z7Z6_TETSI|nr:hypothetical protein HHK36_013092 [Tetracentron sinense]
MSENFLHFYSNTHLPKTSFLIENKSGCFRTKAAINDGVLKAFNELSFYELLGISESGTVSEIKQVYKQMALKYHLDVRDLFDRDLAMGLRLAFSAGININMMRIF